MSKNDINEAELFQQVHSVQDALNLILRVARGQDSYAPGMAMDFPFQPVGSHNSGLDVSTVKTLTPPTLATKLMIQTVTANIRITFDGTTPSASVGFQIKNGDVPFIVSVVPNMTIKVIQETPTASLQYQWGK